MHVGSTGKRRCSNSVLHGVIREELAAKRWSLTHLAETLGVRLGVVSRWVAEDEDKRVVPLPNMVVQIAQALGLDTIEAFRLAGYLPQVEDPALESVPHEKDIRAMQRRLGRMLKSIPPDEWPRCSEIVTAYMDGLQLLLSRLDGNP